MADNKMLQAILDRVSLVDRKVDGGFKKVNKRIDDLDIKLTKRIDRLGEDIAYLEDDAPTIKDFNNLEKRVRKLEIRLTM